MVKFGERIFEKKCKRTLKRFKIISDTGDVSQRKERMDGGSSFVYT